MIFGALGLSILIGAAGGGYFFWLKARLKPPPAALRKKENISSVSASVPASEQASSQMEGEKKEDLPDTSVPEEVSSDNSNQELPPAGDNNPGEEEIQPGGIILKVLKKGAPAGRAQQTKDILASKGYLQVEVRDGQGSSILANTVFYKDDKFRLEAETIRELLIQNEKIYSGIVKASSAEEKSADIVIMLGKNKEAPPE